jgi:hypothetical protein
MTYSYIEGLDQTSSITCTGALEAARQRKGRLKASWLGSAPADSSRAIRPDGTCYHGCGWGRVVNNQAAYQRGARVISVVCSEAKRIWPHQNGAADVTVGLDDAIDVVSRFTDGKGVDVVFDGIGADTADRVFAAGTVRAGGTIISFGASGGWPKVDPDTVALRRATVLAPQALTYLKSAGELRAAMAEVFALYRSGVFGEIAVTHYLLRNAAFLRQDVEAALPPVSWCFYHELSLLPNPSEKA